jgi:hypothetical protein
MTQPQPTVLPELTYPKYGFNQYAERLNGRAAMVGFIVTIGLEFLTGKGLLGLLGLHS